MHLLEEDGIEITDLFLDLWVSPDLKWKVLDEDELEEAFKRGWITERLCLKAKLEMRKLVESVIRGKFPPPRVKELEEKLLL